ncbi:hypothetical protein [Paenibacillus alvei]|uniref:hypothetical protein n=1 Tax=Paenibacillus alvei TaxID=44250 RepID=UPI0022828AEE|nr:hypothetical protein [Paenibacillus alvei]MCY7488140.1 hypothetical protein [Paenibacillus alvei]
MEEIKMNPNMTRVNIRITKELHQMYKSESEKTGISMSILMFKDLEQMRQQRFVVEMLPQMMSALGSMGIDVTNIGEQLQMAEAQ